ncbi:MAG: LuxR C-terminal-related transcriptional regulator [Pseudomonadota bacterium]
MTGGAEELETRLCGWGFTGFEAFMTSRTLESQGGGFDTVTTSLGSNAPGAKLAAGAIARLLEETGGLPAMALVDEALLERLEEPQLAALRNRARDAGLGATWVFALPAGDRVGLCAAYTIDPSLSADTLDLCLGALRRFFAHWLDAHPSGPAIDSADYVKRFTNREREVLEWCAEGKTNWEIARILSVTENTVRFHLKNAFRKLDATSRAAAISAAARRGVIAQPPSARKAALRELYRAYVEGDAGPLRRLLADDVVLVATAPSELFPQGGRYEGPEAVLQHAALVARDFDCRRFLPRMMVEEGDHVATYLDVDLIHRPTGRVLQFDCSHFMTFRGEKLIHYVELFNTALAHRQIMGDGASATPPP